MENYLMVMFMIEKSKGKDTSLKFIRGKLNI